MLARCWSMATSRARPALTSVASGATLGGIGTIGGDVTLADGATLAPGSGGAGALTINGSLALSGGSLLAYDFGHANAPGSPLNDVVNVGGDLTLDGTINVAVTPGGAFDIGLYRVINYGGTLTDNGLAIGTMPAGADVFVQTAVANQVNLINTGRRCSTSGTARPDRSSTARSTAATASGRTAAATTTGPMRPARSTPAMTTARSRSSPAHRGTVTIDNGLGAVTASGLQFAADGYTITGGDLTLTGPQSVIRVGDGTAAGAGYTATINSAITGATQLVKTDAGTLVLIGHQQLHRRHRDQRRHAPHRERRQSRRGRRRAELQRRYAQYHRRLELGARGRPGGRRHRSSPIRARR